MDELKPCPFCGKSPVTSPSGEGGKGLMVECLTEGCVNPHTSYYDHASAIRTWNTRAASGGLNEPFGNPEQFDVDEPSGNSRQLASLEQRADDLFWSLMQAPYADTTIGNIVCAETTPQRLVSAWMPLLTAALANQQGVGRWQPIETAPQGTMILLADMTAKEARHWSFVGWKHHWNKAGHVETPSALNRRATHWKHLPEAPTQPAGDVGREG